MKSVRFHRSRWLLGFMGLLASCGSGTGSDVAGLQQAQQSCPTGVVQVAVRDGMLQHLCGCQEPAGQITAQGSVFNCTFTVGSGVQLFVHYVATQLSHQIVPLGTPSFPPSPVHNPTESSPFLTHSFRIQASGTYRFQDQFNAALQGRFNAL